MPKHGRVPRPKHIFPQTAAAYFTVRQSLLWVERFFHEDAGWFPVWTIGAASGTAGLMLAVLLFIFHDPAAAVGTTDIPENSVTSVEIEPEPTPAEPQAPTADVVPIIFPPSRSHLTLGIERLRMQSPWDDRDFVATTMSRPPERVQLPFGVPTPWSQSLARTNVEPRFEPYFQSTGHYPASPVVVAASNRVNVLQPVGHSKLPGLRVEKLMSATATIGDPFTYIIQVKNVSGDVIPSVEVRERISTLHRVEQVEPAAHVEADELVWHLNQMPAGDVRELRITVRPDEQREVTSETSFSAVTRIAATSHVIPGQVTEDVIPTAVPLRIQPVEPQPLVPEVVPVTPLPDPPILPDFAPAAEPELRPELELKVSEVGVLHRGETLSLLFEVTNIGTSPAENVVINVALSKEFQHRFGEYVEHRIERLEPGKTHQAKLKAIARKEGSGQLATELTMKGTPQETTAFDVAIQPLVDDQVVPASEEKPASKSSEIDACWRFSIDRENVTSPPTQIDTVSSSSIVDLKN
ncbi:MAG: hypothetical protein KDA88_12910 [Planctomycetaceae bacterium]|nr:hypothetical protein [Planctomycetaceae bacterium]